MSDHSDLLILITASRDRVRKEKNELRAALIDLLTKPHCTECQKTALDLVARIHNE